jgi:hypothetical protein
MVEMKDLIFKQLQASEVGSKSNLDSTIQGLHFKLEFKGKSVCPKAFAHLYGVSAHEVETIVKKRFIGADREQDFVGVFDPETSKPIEKGICATKIHDDSWKSKVVSFLDMLAHEEGQRGWNDFVILPYARKEDVFRIAKQCFGMNHLNLDTFKVYWSEERNKILTKEHKGHLLCTTCGKFQEQIDNLVKKIRSTAVNREINEKELSTAREQLHAHKQTAQEQQNESKKYREQARDSPHVLSLCCDYASCISLPRTHHMMFDISRKSKLAVRIGCFYVDNWSLSHYYIHPVFTESANSVISGLYQVLQLVSQSSHRKLFLSFDNHSTNKNNSLFCFLFHLTLLRWFDEIVVLYFLQGEGKDRADTAHAHLFNSIRSAPLYSISDILESTHARSINLHWLQDIRDWDRYYSDIMHKLSNISQPHM